MLHSIASLGRAYHLLIKADAATLCAIVLALFTTCSVTWADPPGPGNAADSGEEPAAVEVRPSLRDLDEENAALLAERIEQLEQIRALANEAKDAAVAEYANLLVQLLEARVESTELRLRYIKLEQVVDGYKHQLRLLKQRRGDLEERLEEAVAASQDVARDRLKLIRLPLAQKTTKEEVPVFVAGRRMSFVLRYDQRGQATAINSADVLVNNLSRSVRPRAGRGLLVEDTARWRAALRQQLAKFKPARDFLLLAVWPDSYAQFELLRDQLVEMGYNYGILLPKEGEWIGSGGGSNRIQG